MCLIDACSFFVDLFVFSLSRATAIDTKIRAETNVRKI